MEVANDPQISLDDHDDDDDDEDEYKYAYEYEYEYDDDDDDEDEEEDDDDGDDGDVVTYCTRWRGVSHVYLKLCFLVTFSSPKLIAILRAGRYAAGLQIMWKAGPGFIWRVRANLHILTISYYAIVSMKRQACWQEFSWLICSDMQ